MAKKQSFHSKAINAVITAIVRVLLGWAEEWGNDAFFFLIIGDKTCTDVAWHNTENLSCEGALALVENGPKVAGAFQDIETSFDILLEDRLKDNEDFRKEFEKSSPSKDDQGWYSIENNEVK
jgi:hypothetical protein